MLGKPRGVHAFQGKLGGDLGARVTRTDDGDTGEPYTFSTGAELAARRESWEPVEPKFTTGVLGKYAKLVHSAAEGAYLG